MVTVVDCVKRTSHEGNEFIALIVQNELEIVTSKAGNVYVAAHRASVPCTLDMESAKLMLGKTLPGTIEKVQCKPFETANADGELVTIGHRYQYVPENHVTEHHGNEVVELSELEAETV